MLVLTGRDGNAGVHDKVCADEAITYIVRVFGLGPRREGDGALDQERLTKVESDEAYARWNDGEKTPFEPAEIQVKK